MEDLLKALVEAVRAGSSLALPAVIGYFLVRVLEALATLAEFLGVTWIISRTILAGIRLTHRMCPSCRGRLE